MAEFHELIKNFNKCRDYVRDFFVYGFKSRQDFTSDRKSARTYDDERRRITSWLSEYVVEDMTESGKNISLQIDSNLLDTNPLFAVWKTKSFTDNDILLHFYLPDILGDNAYSAAELADILSGEYSFAADTQLVRRKCNEYVKEGLLVTEKDGKTLLYKRGLSWRELCNMEHSAKSDTSSMCNNPYKSDTPGTASISDKNMGKLSTGLTDAISLLQLDSPFGYAGNTILDKLQDKNHIFHVKHYFPTFTLEEEIAYELLEAKNDHAYVKMEVQSNKSSSRANTHYGIPLRIFVSSRTGRRYICFYHIIHRGTHENNKAKKREYHFSCIRLDQIKSVTLVSPKDMTEAKQIEIAEAKNAYDKMEKALDRNLDNVWGVSFMGTKTKVSLTLNIDEKYEGYIINRLEREGKHGSITRLSDNTFLYEKIVFDANEMFPWLRTFTGRIIDIHFKTVDQNGNEVSENRTLRRHFLDDIKSTCSIYGL